MIIFGFIVGLVAGLAIVIFTAVEPMARYILELEEDIKELRKRNNKTC